MSGQIQARMLSISSDRSRPGIKREITFDFPLPHRGEIRWPAIIIKIETPRTDFVGILKLNICRIAVNRVPRDVFPRKAVGNQIISLK